MRPAIIAAAICGLTFNSPAIARTWLVGPDQAIKTPSEEARQAGDGDRVQVEAVARGYYDCAVWRQNNLTIEGIGSDVRITDTTCHGKALFVIDGCVFRAKSATDSGMKSATDSDLKSATP